MKKLWILLGLAVASFTLGFAIAGSGGPGGHPPSSPPPVPDICQIVECMWV